MPVFQTNPYDLHELLGDCHHGVLQLPDFQRSWVWDEDRIKSLIASISRAFPVGAFASVFRPSTVHVGKYVVDAERSGQFRDSAGLRPIA